jgi:predicted MPP superfamily phosphohydrolase
LRSRLIILISIVQSIIFLGHWFLYLTWSSFWGGPASSLAVKLALTLLSVSFVGASLRGWYSFRPLVRLWYTFAAVWVGVFSYCFWAAVLCWIADAVSVILGLGWPSVLIADVLFGAAALVSLYGLINSNLLRVTRISIALPGLPAQWRGRTAALVSDLHLGHVRNQRFVRRVVSQLRDLQPDVVFIAGDLYDGTAGDFEKLAEPWTEFLSLAQAHNQGPAQAEATGGEHYAGAFERSSASAQARVPFARLRAGSALHNPGPRGAAAGQPATAVLGPPAYFHGVYYIAGNHEEFYSHAEYLPALMRSGVRVLNNEKVELDGLQVVGVHYRDAIEPENYRAILRHAVLDRSRASILLLHAPVKLAIAEEEGISLQLSGHTHGGQFFPYTWIAGRVWGKFIHGLQRLGNLQVYTSYGAGTWGPPLRVGTWPEIVLIGFE